jgi:elongation factor G
MLRVLSPNHLTITGRCLSVSRFSFVEKQSQARESFSFNSQCRLDTSYTTTRKRRFKSTAAVGEGGDSRDHNCSTIRPLEPSAISSAAAKEIHRLKHIRNVGILAHVDAGKTTVTERMLALAGVVRSAGSVDNGNTVTDYLPAERERGITIQSAAVSFNWGWHNNRRGNDYEANDNVKIQLIDTPGHVDFSVEVNRSVAVLDGAVLVVDAVAGVQAQTETVWRALTKPSWNNHELPRSDTIPQQQTHEHEPLPCLALINKMDKDGCHFGKAIESLRHKLPGANPIAIQMPLFRETTGNGGSRQKIKGGSDNSMKKQDKLCSSIIAVPADDVTTALGEFVGVVDLIHMRAIVWPEDMNATPNGGLSNVENCVPKVINLLKPQSREPIDPLCRVTKQAIAARSDFVEALAEVDPKTEEYYLNDEEPSNAELRAGLRRATLSRKVLPVMAGAAVRGLGVEPLLDSIADLLPSPLDRLPPALTKLENSREEGAWANKKRSARKSSNKAEVGKDAETSASSGISQDASSRSAVTLGHPLHPSLIALAFKVVHMKGRGGSGDGRVVFARVYSGTLKDRDAVKVISPPAPGEISAKPRVERIGGMLELSGGRFDNIDNGICSSGEVCALVGLKGVVTGDTIYLGPNDKMSAKSDVVCLAGVSSPKPVLTVRLEVSILRMESMWFLRSSVIVSLTVALRTLVSFVSFRFHRSQRPINRPAFPTHWRSWRLRIRV